jgi:hypothetical protein
MLSYATLHHNFSRACSQVRRVRCWPKRDRRSPSQTVLSFGDYVHGRWNCASDGSGKS